MGITFQPHEVKPFTTDLGEDVVKHEDYLSLLEMYQALQDSLVILGKEQLNQN